MNDEIKQDGFFTEASYAAATDLANTIGPLFREIARGAEPDWFSASFDINKARVHKMLLDEFATEFDEARWAGFFLLEPLVKAREKSMPKWVAYLERVRDAFPAFQADVVLGERKHFTKEQAEQDAIQRYTSKRAA